MLRDVPHHIIRLAERACTRDTCATPWSLLAAPAHESEKAYSDALNAILDTKGKLRQMQIEYDRSAYDLQTRLDEKEYKAKEIAESFREFKREIAFALAGQKDVYESALEDLRADMQAQLDSSNAELAALKGAQARGQRSGFA